MDQRTSSERQAGPPEIHRQILEYLVKNPNAGDTVDGIVQWWLMEQQLIETVQAVKTALDALVDCGWVQAKQAGDKHWHYWMNEDKRDEIEAFLRSSGYR